MSSAKKERLVCSRCRRSYRAKHKPAPNEPAVCGECKKKSKQ